MKFRIEKSFDRDIDRIRDKALLKKLRTLISAFETAETLHGIPHIKKLKGTNHFTPLEMTACPVRYQISNRMKKHGVNASCESLLTGFTE